MYCEYVRPLHNGFINQLRKGDDGKRNGYHETSWAFSFCAGKSGKGKACAKKRRPRSFLVSRIVDRFILDKR